MRRTCGKILVVASLLALFAATTTSLAARRTENELIEDLTSSQQGRVIEALQLLAEQYPNSTKSVPKIKELLLDSRPDVRRKAARVLGVLHAELNAENVSAIVALLKSSNADEILDGLKALRGIDAPEAVPEILPLLERSEEEVLKEACRTLAVLGDKDDIPSIEPLLNRAIKDPAFIRALSVNSWVRGGKSYAVKEEAENAIKKLRTKTAVGSKGNDVPIPIPGMANLYLFYRGQIEKGWPVNGNGITLGFLGKRSYFQISAREGWHKITAGAPPAQPASLDVQVEGGKTYFLIIEDEQVATGSAVGFFRVLMSNESEQEGRRKLRRYRRADSSITNLDISAASPGTLANTSVQIPVAVPVVQPPVSKRIDALWQPSGRRKIWVLTLGVGQYKNPLIPSLPFAKQDAERVRDWVLRFSGEHIDRDCVHVLLDEQATRVNLLGQIDWLRKQALEEDAVLLYFAAHGAPELAPDGRSVDAKYLLLHDTEPDQLFATGFSLDDLTRKLESVKAKVQIVILEACYTGPIGKEVLKTTPTADLEIRPRLIQEMGERGGRVILSASSGRQVAIGAGSIKGGLFTHHLLNAWADGSRRLLSECFEEARDKVRRAANQLGSTQEPTKFGDQNLDVVLKVK